MLYIPSILLIYASTGSLKVFNSWSCSSGQQNAITGEISGIKTCFLSGLHKPKPHSYCATQCADTWPCLLPSLCLPKQFGEVSSDALVLYMEEVGPTAYIQILKNSGSKSQFCSFMDHRAVSAVWRGPVTTMLTQMGFFISTWSYQGAPIWLRWAPSDLLYPNHSTARLKALSMSRVKSLNLCTETVILI